MPPHPKRKLSRTRGATRRAHKALVPANLSPCPSCGKPRLPHRACPNCGTYAGRTVLPQPAKPEET
ncbi:MAG: 50S ribosomal protein L32 [Chloroflexi bacterium]|nr:50S ribosomal protein L32 [Chloroflexota bacterium]